MSGIWSPLVSLVQRYSDTDRPFRLAQVLDTSQWSATGASFVQVRVADSARLAIYRDGPRPAVGGYLHVVQTGPGTSAPWLALPLPQPVAAGCAGQLYVSAQRTDTGAWDVIRCDLAVGNVWQYRSPSPVSGSYPRRPLHSYRGTRLLTWGSSADLATPGPLYYSDDAGLTWTSCGISITNLSRQKYGYVYAVGGNNLYMSVDSGATWTSWPAPGAGPLYAVATTQAALDRSVAVLGPDGIYEGTFAPSTGEPFDWTGPTAPGGAGWATVGTWWAGGASSSGTAPPGGVDSPGREFDQADDVLHAATGGAAYRHVPQATELLYQPAPGVGSRDLYYLTNNSPAQWPIGSYGMVDPCYVVALDATASGATRYVARQQSDSAAWYDFGARQVGDLGAAYVASAQGLTTLQFWEYNAGAASPAPAPLYSVVGGARAVVSAPSGWQAVAFDATGWPVTVLASGLSGIDGGDLVRPDATPSPTAYVRQVFTVAAGVTHATLDLAVNDAGVTAVYVNGVEFYNGPAARTTYTFDISAALVLGGSNLLAFAAAAAIGTTTACAYKVTFS